MKKYIEGDLIELYHERLQRGKLSADLLFIWDVILLCRPGIIRPAEPYRNLNTYAMYRSYFKIGWRNLIKNKAYSVINIGGLALGIAVALMIGLWVHDELSFNHYHKNYDRIGKIMKAGTVEGRPWFGQTTVQYPLINELKTNYNASLKYVVPTHGQWGGVLSTSEKKLAKTGMYLGEDAPEMFTWQMIYGNRNALKDISGIAVSEATAIALFGDDDPLGKIVSINGSQSATITGVFADFPKSSFLFGVEFVQSWAFYEKDAPWITKQGWDNHMIEIYVQIADGLTMAQAEENIKSAEKIAIKDLDYMKSDFKYDFEDLILPMNDWHLRASFKEGRLQSGPVQLVWFIGAIGVFILLLACINFMNLSTARSEKRAKEVGIRKSIGSVRIELVKQFFSESFLVVLLSLVLALVIDALLMPSFNVLSNKGLTLPLGNPYFWLSLTTFTLVTGLVAGSYPALYLSSFKPVSILRGTYRTGRFASLPRKVLVIVQFTVSIMLIACTGAIYNQLMFVKDRNVGYDREGLLMIRKKSDDFDKKRDVLETQLKNTGMVSYVAEAGGDVTYTWSGNGGFTWKGIDPMLDAVFTTLDVSPDFGKTVGWNFVEGRDFSKEIKSDTMGFVINEAAVKYMKITDPIGKVVHWKNKPWGVDYDYRIIGVIKDMVMESPFEPVSPTIYFTFGYHRVMLVRVTPGKTMAEAIPKIEKVFTSIIPDVPFGYKFADQEFATKFSNEERVGKLAGLFATLAILISCLGLFGLAAYVAERRTKEIGIRKVLGASVATLWRMLSREFVTLVVISCFIGTPLAYYIVKSGISRYEYHAEIEWLIFALSALGAIVITIATVSIQAIRAATANPVNSLRSE